MKQFFQEDNGKFSMTRLAMFIMVLVCAFFIVMLGLKTYFMTPVIYQMGENIQGVHPADYSFLYAAAFLILGSLASVGFSKVSQKEKEANVDRSLLPKDEKVVSI